MLGLRVNTKITFTQLTTYRSASGQALPRSGTIVVKFVVNYDISTTWDSLTDDGSITLPKNVYVTDKNGNRFSLYGTNVNIGGFTDNPPVFLRGDAVKIERGYIYHDNAGNELAPLNTVFEGYISDVESKKPIVLKVEDSMYLLKKTPAVGLNGRVHFPGKQYNAENIIREIFQAQNLKFTVNGLTETTIGDIWTENESIAQLLARMQKDYHFRPYFKGTELRIGSFPYIPADAQAAGRQVFKFQQNIISDDLTFKRKDDITISAVVSSVTDENTGKTTKDGHAKTKKKRLEALITFENGSDTPKVYIASKEKPIPPNTGGERYDFQFWGISSIDELVKHGTNKLRLFYYTGFKGRFTTFGLPHIEMGTDVDIIDPLLPERNGRYKVKAVQYTGGIDGNRQIITLDYLVGRLDPNGKFIGK